MERKTTRALIVSAMRCVPTVVKLKRLSFFQMKREILKIKTEENSTYPEARKFVSVTNDSNTKKYASIVKPIFNSVATQTMFTRFENMDKPTRLTVQPTASKTNTPSKRHQVHLKHPALREKLKLQFHLQTMERNILRINFPKVNTPEVLNRNMER